MKLVCPQCFYDFKSRMDFILFEEQSTTARMLFGLVTLMIGWFVMFSPTSHSDLSEYRLMLKIAPDWLWATGFWVNGAALMYGAYTNKFSKLQLMLEGTLGVTIWCGSAYAVTITQETIGGHFAGALISFWIYIRYPTHWGHDDGV